jgi:hypothetical protein
MAKWPVDNHFHQETHIRLPVLWAECESFYRAASVCAASLRAASLCAASLRAASLRAASIVAAFLAAWVLAIVLVLSSDISRCLVKGSLVVLN